MSKLSKLHILNICSLSCINYTSIMCESHSVMSDSLLPYGLHSPWNSLGQNTGVDSLSLHQGTSQPRSPALQADSLPAEPQGKPPQMEWVAYPFSRGFSQPRNPTAVSSIAGGFFTNWAIREALPWWRKWQLTPYSCLGNPMDRETWCTIVHGVAKSHMTEHRHTFV